jgi:hypothetical protein
MLCKYPASLEIKREVVGHPLCPEVAIPLAKHCVIAAIHFDNVELAGIVLKARFG